MEVSKEVIMIVDEQDRPVGSATKKEAWEKGLRHRVVRVIVDDGHGRILLQKRSPSKQPYPGRWDNSSAGHVDPGEDYTDAAKRELSEELGITDVQLQEVGSYSSRKTYEWRKLNRFNKVYKATVSPGVALQFEPEETSEVTWFNIEEAKKLCAEHPEKCTHGLCYVLEHFF